jgi:phage tail tape-measure protein
MLSSVPVATELANGALTQDLQSWVGLGAGPFDAQAQLGLARAYAKGGDKADAKRAYDAISLTGKNADADLPMLVAA